MPFVEDCFSLFLAWKVNAIGNVRPFRGKGEIKKNGGLTYGNASILSGVRYEETLVKEMTPTVPDFSGENVEQGRSGSV